MTIISYGDVCTNISKKSEAYSLLQEINNFHGFEKLFITETFYRKGFFKKKRLSFFSVYHKLAKGEYQHMMAFKSLNEVAVECYLLGYLNGIIALPENESE